MTAELDAMRDRTARYIAGTLSLAEARQLEAAFQADPALGERMGIHIRLGRIMNLLEGDGRPAARPPFWHDQRVAIGAAALIAVLLVALIYATVRWNVAADRVAILVQRTEQGLLEAASTTRRVVIDVESRRTTAVSSGLQAARLDLKLLVKTRRFEVFSVTVERTDGVSVLTADRMQRDSNGHLNLSLNTSAVPAGDYTLVIDGVTPLGKHVPVARAQLEITAAG